MMPENTVLMIIVVIMSAGLLATLAYFIARFMRGSIKLSLPRVAFNPGDIIKGSFCLQTKKVIVGNRLIVSLVGVRITKTQKNGETESTSDEIYRDEVVLEDATEYAAGTIKTYNFEIATPNMQSSEFLNSTAGQALSTAVRLFSNRSTQLKWTIEARLDAKGIDLATKKTVSLNIKQIL